MAAAILLPGLTIFRGCEECDNGSFSYRMIRKHIYWDSIRPPDNFVRLRRPYARNVTKRFSASHQCKRVPRQDGGNWDGIQFSIQYIDLVRRTQIYMYDTFVTRSSQKTSTVSVPYFTFVRNQYDIKVMNPSMHNGNILKAIELNEQTPPYWFCHAWTFSFPKQCIFFRNIITTPTNDKPISLI